LLSSTCLANPLLASHLQHGNMHDADAGPDGLRRMIYQSKW